VSNPPPQPFWKERKNRKKNKNTYKERKPFRAGKHPISFTSRGLLGDGRRPAPPEHITKSVVHSLLSFTQEIERRRRREEEEEETERSAVVGGIDFPG
jgi:hypothetical protein